MYVPQVRSKCGADRKYDICKVCGTRGYWVRVNKLAVTKLISATLVPRPQHRYRTKSLNLLSTDTEPLRQPRRGQLHSPRPTSFPVHAMLLSRIQEVTSDNTPESIFASSLTSLFPDSNVSSHGDAGHLIAYASPRFGNVELQIPHRPTEEEGRQLFAHYLWNSAAVVASKVEEATCDTSSTTDETAGWWDVKGSRVLELGAGSCMLRVNTIRRKI